jgi:hypothetical protein
MLRTTLFVAILLAAAGIPILLSKYGNGQHPTPVVGQMLESTGRTASSDPSDRPGVPTGGRKQRAKRPIDPELDALLHPQRNTHATVAPVPISPLPDILRFDLTPAYVAQKWPRVSTTLSDLELSGMRASVVTGTSPQDLHGSVSYYFDRSQRTRRIVLHGFTGDAEPIVQFVQSMYRLQEYASVGERIFISHQDGQPLSLLRIRNAPVMAVDRPFAQQEIILELNAPHEGARLSNGSLETLRRMRNAHLL